MSVDEDDGRDVILNIKAISKRYGGLQALDDVHIDVKEGEVHAVVGENGAGKSTLMKILAGIINRDRGTITFRGEEVVFTSPQESIAAGIAIIHQELSVLPTMNVIENVYMGRMPNNFGRVLWSEMDKGTAEVLKRVGLDVNPLTLMNDLTISQKQLIEIAKAISVDARVIIMDEPNSSLSESETKVLFDVIRELKSHGIAIIYVSHKIEEVLEISDRITVLRDGKYMNTILKADATVDKIIQMMVGRELKREHIYSPHIGKVKLKVTGLSSDKFTDVSFTLREGEILCFSGLVGAGRSEVARAIFGADPFDKGEIIFEGKPVRFRSPKEALENGIAMLAEDRKKLSLFIGLSIKLNMSISELPRLKRGMRIDQKKTDAIIEDFIKKLNIKLVSPDFPVSSLSGGNQQKTVIARWLATKPKILILDEPTHGVDVGAKVEIYALIRDFARSGISIILISSELPEVITMADRVLVMYEGQITGILYRKHLSEEKLMACATGFIDENLKTVLSNGG